MAAESAGNSRRAVSEYSRGKDEVLENDCRCRSPIHVFVVLRAYGEQFPTGVVPNARLII